MPAEKQQRFSIGLPAGTEGFLRSRRDNSGRTTAAGDERNFLPSILCEFKGNLRSIGRPLGICCLGWSECELLALAAVYPALPEDPIRKGDVCHPFAVPRVAYR